MIKKRTKFLAEVTDKKGKEFTVSFKALVHTFSGAEAFLNVKGYKVQKVVRARDHHICKYCNRISEGSYEDSLCSYCQYAFGHSLYSELSNSLN